MNRDDLPSDSDTDDSDYRPANDSGSDSIDEKDEQIEEQNEDGPIKNKKRRKKGRKSSAVKEDIVGEQREVTNKTVGDPEEEKKRVDALWADFLSGTDIPEKEPSKDTLKSAMPKKDIPKTHKVTQPAPKIFEFAGETIEIERNDQEKAAENSSNKAGASTNSLGIKRPISGGLSSVLDQLSKKNKLSVLEKTKIDWDGFKSAEGISEELKTHNKGRAGFLERRDFLERTDFRQFEIEKNLRTSSKRSNK